MAIELVPLCTIRIQATPHPKLNHRTMQVWGPLFAVTLTADGGMPGLWTHRLLTAFELVTTERGGLRQNHRKCRECLNSVSNHSSK